MLHVQIHGYIIIEASKIKYDACKHTMYVAVINDMQISIQSIKSIIHANVFAWAYLLEI
jgi:hypothetical protein